MTIVRPFKGRIPLTDELIEQAKREGQQRILGKDAELFEVPDDFDAPLPDDVLDEFEEGSIEPSSDHARREGRE